MQRSVQPEKETALHCLSNVITLNNLSCDVLPQEIEPMGVESFDLGTLAHLHQQCQLGPVLVLQTKQQRN